MKPSPAEVLGDLSQEGDVARWSSPSALPPLPGSAPAAPAPTPPALTPLWRVWLALWGPFPFLNWLGLLGALRPRLLPPELRWLIWAFVGLSLLGALFTPRPQAALVVGGLRALFLVGLLITGWQLGRARHLLALLPGLVAVLITALAYTAVQTGLNTGLLGRLLHPSYQYVSLGLAAALTLWLAVFWPERTGGPDMTDRAGRPGWQALGWQALGWQALGWQTPLRWGAGLLAAVVLVLGGSRAPLAAALIGLLIGALCSGRADYSTVPAGARRGRLNGGQLNRWRLGGGVAAALLVAGGFTLLAFRPELVRPRLAQSAAVTHLTQLGLNGRGTYWEEATGVFRALPLGGTGVGQLGNAVRSTQENCFQGWPTQNVGCPGWMLRLSRQPWFAPARKLSWLAHNGALHSLAETGLIGTAALFLMLGLVLAAAFASRSALLIAVVTGYSVVNLFDNSATLPSLAVSEVFWLAGGVALREGYQHTGRASSFFAVGASLVWRAPVWGAGLLLLTLVPVVVPGLLPASGTPPRLLALNVARQAAGADVSTLHLGLGNLSGGGISGGSPSGGLPRLRLELCTPVCGVERVQDLTPDADGQWWGAVALPRLLPGTTVRLQVLPPETGFLAVRPLGEVVWKQP